MDFKTAQRNHWLADSFLVYLFYDTTVRACCHVLLSTTCLALSKEFRKNGTRITALAGRHSKQGDSRLSNMSPVLFTMTGLIDCGHLATQYQMESEYASTICRNLFLYYHSLRVLCAPTRLPIFMDGLALFLFVSPLLQHLHVMLKQYLYLTAIE